MNADERKARESFIAGLLTFALAADHRFDFVDANVSVTPASMRFDVAIPMFSTPSRVVVSVVVEGSA